ncbi:MAG: hypothetical protein ACOCPR_06140 [Guyparkeria sp.]
MSNDYFNYQPNILPGGVARSQPITQSLDAIARAFELLPNPIKDGAGTRGFSQSLPIGAAQQNNQAATLGQVKALGDIFTSAPVEVQAMVLQAQQAQLDAQGAYAAAQAIADALFEQQAQANALLGLGIGSSVVDDDGNLIMTYADSVESIEIVDGYLTLTF